MSKIRAFILDVDGVLTDSMIYLSDNGEETKTFNTKDGHGIKLLQRAGIEVAICTGRRSKAVEHRAEELGIQHVIQGAWDKKSSIAELSKALGLKTSQMAYMGDDVVDLPAMRQCALSFAPSDAVEIVRDWVDVVTQRPGGRGAVREAIEIILKKEGLWEQILERYV